MRLGVISDIHGNHIALLQGLNLLKSLNVDDVFFLGDAIGYLPAANEVLAELRQQGVQCLLGNHEAMLLGWLPLEEKSDVVYQLRRSAETLHPENIGFIKTLVPFREVNAGGMRLLMVHGSPVNPLNGYIYPDTDLNSIQVKGYDFILTGHTHRPFIRKQGTTRFVNVGSCGLPRDRGDILSLAVVDTKDQSAIVYRTPMDVTAMDREYGTWVHSDIKNLWARETGSQNFFGKLIANT